MERKSLSEITELAEFIAKTLDERKGIDVEILHVGEQSSLADYFVVCSGSSGPHVKALVAEVEEKVRAQFQLEPHASEGYQSRRWVLLDYQDVVVHVFTKEEREFYSLERLWKHSGRNAQGDLTIED